MKCPKDNTEMKKVDYKGIELDECSTCSGVWLNGEELDQVEDTQLDIDIVKGSLVWQEKETAFGCPVCERKMMSFRYRMWENLELDFCVNKHGWWLDQGELEKVEDSMMDRKEDVLRKYSEESDWEYKVKAIRSPTYLDNVVVWVNEFVEDAFKKEAD